MDGSAGPRGGRARRVEGWGGVLEEYRVHVHVYTYVGSRITMGKNCKLLNCKSYSTIFNSSGDKINQNLARSWLDKAQKNLSQFVVLRLQWSKNYSDCPMCLLKLRNYVVFGQAWQRAKYSDRLLDLFVQQETPFWQLSKIASIQWYL
jgi:hypothetical protein